MPIDLARARQYLRNFDFKTLFVEELGWNRHRMQPLNIEVDGSTYTLNALVEKRGLVTFLCDPDPDGRIPNYAIRRKIEKQAAKSVHEHLIIYCNAARTTQTWQWVKREPGKPVACREHTYHRGQTGELLAQKLQAIAFDLEEEENLTIFDVADRVRQGFYAERVTKRFYERFQAEHDVFLRFIQGIPDAELQRWYASVMLNRLMFIYFIQKKGFLGEDQNYLRNKLTESRLRARDRFYQEFICPLFFEGFAKQAEDRSPEINRLLGQVPYLNGGIFLKHEIEIRQEQEGRETRIPDTAFEKIFAFFDAYHWHLDERPVRADNEINPDVLGYIFEKYINQKQMGAYYTKEDITEYFSKNTIIPFLFDAAEKKCAIAFKEDSALWRLLRDDPDRYIYDAVRQGVDLELPTEIAAGINDVGKRGDWNKSATAEFALPTETWREHMARRRRCREVRAKLAVGEIHSIDDLVTYNLNLRQFAQDVIENCEGPELLRAFYHAIEKVTVLDPTCGSGAFLFAALNILEPLYDACLDRMAVFVEELERSGVKHHPQQFSDFKQILARIEEHPNHRYFVLKSIIIRNLYGVDIMHEAVEICKLRLFLKLVAQVDSAEKIEPLPDIDFNIRAGNTLVGYATQDEVRHVTSMASNGQKKLIFGEVEDAYKRIEIKAADIQQLFDAFRKRQVEGDGSVPPEHKLRLKEMLKDLANNLDRYLAGQYGINQINFSKTEYEGSFKDWRDTHQPFHWFSEFYGIIKSGGFDVVIGNPPYVEYKDIRGIYEVRNYLTEQCSNLFAFILERCAMLSRVGSQIGMIVPLSAFSTDRMTPLINHLKGKSQRLNIANFSWRPGKLFDGVNLQLSILLQKVSQQLERIETTRYLSWNSEARPELFSRIEYAVVEDNRLDGCIPKLGITEASSILTKLRLHKKEIGNCFTRRSNNKVFYRRGGLYWKVFVDFETGSSEEKEIHVMPEIDKYSVIAALSSDLWWWYFTSTSDCRHLGNRDINTFPFYPVDMSAENQELLSNLGRRYVKDIKKNAQQAVRVYKGKKAVECLSFRVNQSKPIIDEIDRVLARHYGLTDEELDFIINYDIKYRLGVEGEE